MRLFELLTEAPPKVSYHSRPTSTSTIDRLPLDPGEDSKTARGSHKMGSGAFAAVYGHDDNPHEVVKLSEPRSKKRIDGYEAFVRQLSRDPEMHENPHLPRIHIVRNIYNKDNDERQYIVRMEKLYPWAQLSEEEYEIMVKHTFTDSFIAQVNNSLPEWRKDRLYWSVFMQWVERSFVSADYIPEKAYTALKSKDLQNALTKIARLADKENVRLDIHSANIMFRKTQYGPVLVITDPLSSSRFS